MIKKIAYVFAFILGLIIVAAVATISTTYSKNHDFSLEINNNVIESHDFEPFVAYRVPFYKSVDRIYSEQYILEVYHVLDKSAATNERNKILIMIIPIDSLVKIADNSSDTNDNSRLLIYTSESVLLDSKITLKDYALSYGFNKDVVGFMYLSAVISKDSNINFEYYDYENNFIADGSYDFNTYNLEDESKLTQNNFKQGYTIEQISEMMNLDDALKTATIASITVYVVLIFIIITSIIVVRRVKNKKQ